MRIVGIGASAGGLAALEDFFRNMPCDTGMTFLVVQHLDPAKKTLLPELLQRRTEMPVREAEHNMPVRPNCIYIIPPNRELRVLDNSLKLAEPNGFRAPQLPIDVLFSSLASDQGEQAVAVVLSGMGSDGTLGLQAIRATGGLSAVQAPASAQFDGMPKSAIAAGCADILAPADELPARLLEYVRRVPGADHNPRASISLAPMDSIFKLLQQHTRHDFSMYKPTTVHRRLERRMAIHGISELDDYAHVLAGNDQEVQLLFRELLIGVTQLFRDPGVWNYLINMALPKLLAAHPPEYEFRAWVAGCSTGEEAYSLAISFMEAVEALTPGRELNLQIFATDISPDAIASARRGRYPLSIEDSMSETRLARFFTRHDSGYQIRPFVRNTILFAQHDIILDPPFTRLDLIACRNLLIYFDPLLQRRILSLFHYSLRPNGLLLLGNAETVGRLSHLFAPLKPTLRLYRKKAHETVGSADPLLKSFPPLSFLAKEQPVSPSHAPSVNTTNQLQLAADRILLQVYSPAAVVLNADADIVYISGRTGKYLEPAAGKANWNIHAMAREGLRGPLFAALKQAAAQSEPVEIRGLSVQTSPGTQAVDVFVQTFSAPTALKGMTMVVFRDAPLRQTSKRRKHIQTKGTDHATEVQQYQEEIVRLTEEVSYSREERQASTEELQSTNEELQSANEELTTSKEEMQSMNEELQTINAELQTKLDDLALAQSDMQYVLNSIEIAVLFLDKDLNVRRYTERAATIINLRETDIGRPLSDLTSSLIYPALKDDARQALKTLEISEKKISTKDNRLFSVRIIPYQRLDDTVDGVVITLVDISENKNLDIVLRKQPES